MYRIYEKVPSSEEYPHGMKLLDKEENPFLTGTCLVSLLAIEQYTRNINAALNFGMEALRLRTKRNEQAEQTLENFEGRILSIAYGEQTEIEGTNGNGKVLAQQTESKQGTSEFVQKYLYPLIELNGNKLDIEQAKKNIRRVNFLAFCNAVGTVQEFGRLLNERMLQVGYSVQDAEQVLSQMYTIGFLSDVIPWKMMKKERIFGTNISCINVNDTELSIPEQIIESVNKEKIVYDETGCFLTANEDNHSAKKVFYEVSDLILGVSSAAIMAMNNSLLNTKIDQFVPLEIERIVDQFGMIAGKKKDGKNNSEIMSIIESMIRYGKASREQEDNGNTER